MAPKVTATTVDEEPQAYEDKHVHAVYDEIASHFSATRYKASFGANESVYSTECEPSP